MKRKLIEIGIRTKRSQNEKEGQELQSALRNDNQEKISIDQEMKQIEHKIRRSCD